jgi:UPF0716 family protein affecting phage T7 exclusion
MSDPQNLMRNRPARHPVVTALMIIAGIILLLPGICSLVFITMFSVGGASVTRDSGLGLLWLVCFAVAAAGIALIYRAVRHRSRSRPGNELS